MDLEDVKVWRMSRCGGCQCEGKISARRFEEIRVFSRKKVRR